MYSVATDDRNDAMHEPRIGQRMAVTRCVCYRMSFTDILARSRENGWSTVAEIGLATGCGMGCGGCRPYLQAILDTHATCFDVRIGDRPPEPCEPEAWDT
jgi:bacterioferritin-associated ferredoxin